MMIATPTVKARPESFDEALAALSMLGFQKSASEKVLNTICKENPALNVEEAILTALKSL
jgi:Holliday junction DNA helicase RuvA